MARGNDPGKDFDDQWNDSFREAQKKAQRGEGPWAEDKYLARRQEQSGPPAHHAGQSKGCADKAVLLLAFLSGWAWALTEIARQVI